MWVPLKFFRRREAFNAGSGSKGRRLRFRRLQALRLLPGSTLLLLAGCANPGPPKPPSLHLPRPVEGLTAVRTGERVSLTWTTPGETTDGGKLQMPIAAVLCRDDDPESPPATPRFPASPNPCKPIQRLSVVPGSSSATDLLPPALTAGAPSLIAYRVELENPASHSSGPSAPVYALRGAAPPPMGPIAVSARRNAVLITWQPRDSPANLPPAPVEIARTLLATATGPVEPPGRKAPKKGGVAPASSKTESFSSADHATLRQATLRLDAAVAQSRSDPGGFFDRSIRDGDTLTYTAQRVRAVELTPPAATFETKDGRPRQTKPMTQVFEIRGEPSPAVAFTFHDVAPPAVPTGLVAVPGGGFGEPPAVDLSWDPNPELDILGYNVYRTEGNGKPVRLNRESTPGPAYRDLTAQPDRNYRYFVRAVDQRGHESGASPPVDVTLRR